MINCPVCKGSTNNVIRSYRYLNPIFSSRFITKCMDCGMVFVSPFPSEALLKNYNLNYFVNAHGGYSKNHILNTFFLGFARLRLIHIEKFLLKYKKNVFNVFEVGPGRGFFSKIWLDRYPGSKYFAYETDNSCFSSLKDLGVELINKDTDISVDLVVMSHVLEHISNPIRFIKELTRGLKRGGVIFIEVPCQDWKYKTLDEPHLLFFEKDSLHRLLKDLGFSDIEITYHGRPIKSLGLISLFFNIYNAIRNKLISWGFIAPFSRVTIGLEMIESPLERAIIKPFKAHRESIKPAWWLRAVARKD